MPRLRELIMFPPGVGELNNKTSPLHLGMEWLTEAKNIEYTTAGARSKRKGQQKINSTGLVEASPSTTVDADSASGQKVLNVASTTGFGAGDYIAIGQGTAREEYGRVDSVQAGVSLTLEKNLSSTHTAAQADTYSIREDKICLFSKQPSLQLLLRLSCHNSSEGEGGRPS